MTNSDEAVLAGHWTAMRAQLNRRGFNLIAAIDCDSIKQHIETDEIPDHGRLLLFAAAGSQLWLNLLADLKDKGSGAESTSIRPVSQSAQPDWHAADTHAVDEFSGRVVVQAASEYLSAYQCHLLYPGDTKILLPALGEYLGWSSPSPLGLGIHPEFGLWFAYRVLCWTDAPLDASPKVEGLPSPCESCVSKPCISACPVAAVSATEQFDLRACAEFRLQPDAICADRCLARLACPVGADYRHSPAQHGYHQKRSLAGLAAWFGSDADN